VDPKAAGLLVLLLLPKLKEEGEAFDENVPKPLVVFDVPAFPKEKLFGVVLVFDVLFPKLNVFVDPVLLLLLLLLPKLNCEGEFVLAPKLPKLEVEVFELLLFPNEVVAKFPKPDVVVPKVEVVEDEDWPKENAEGVPVLGLAPKEKGEPEEVFVEVLPKVLVVEAPKEKGDDEGAEFV